MKKLIKPILIAAVVLAGASPAVVAARAAPAAAGETASVNGIAVANLEAVVFNSDAYKAAQEQRKVTYKAQYDAAEARKSQISAQLQPMVDKFQKDRAAGVAQASLQQQAQTIQQIQEAGNQELQKIMEPVALSDAYVQEQINDKLVTAVQTAMSKAGVTLLLNPQAVLSASNSYNLNQAILTELNTAMPTAQIVPPAGWLPREERDRRAQQAAQGGSRGAGQSDGR